LSEEKRQEEFSAHKRADTPPVVGGDVVHGDKIAGDSYAVGQISGQGIAIGANARSQINNYGDIIVRLDSIEDLPPAPGEPPFKGLTYFSEADAGIFFGREALSDDLVARLHSTQFLGVIGASGSGKSSLLRAGVVPRLRQKNWSIHIMTPTARPLEKLASTLTRDERSLYAADEMSAALASDPRTLLLAANRLAARAEADRLLLLVDQFEELFTLCRDEAERSAFLECLLTAVAEPGTLTVVIGLRADFYDQCLQYEGLRMLLSRQQEAIGPMKQEEIVRVIAEPAKQGGWQFVEGLVEQILENVGQEPGRLPLLSHALRETWERRHGTVMTLAGYRAAGGVEGAIAKTAEETLMRLDESKLPIVQHIFLSLTELGEGSEDTRRISTRAELSQIGSGDEPVNALLEELVRARLITIDGQDVEVAHEALIRRWPRLHDWVSENRDRLRFERRLADDALEWSEELGRDPGALYQGARLAQAVEWSQGSDVVLSPLALEFLESSRELAEREEREKEEQRQHELNQQRALAEEQSKRAEEAETAEARQRRLTRIALGILVVALIAAVLAVFFGLESRNNARLAQESSRVALSRQLLTQSATVLDSQYDLALLLGSEALITSTTPETEGMMNYELIYNPYLSTYLREHAEMVNNLTFVANGKLLASGSEDGQIILWDLESQEPAFPPLEFHQNSVYPIVFNNDRGLLASGSCAQYFDETQEECIQGEIAVWGLAEEGNEARIIFGHDDSIRELAFSPDGNFLASTAGTSLILWDVDTLEPIWELVLDGNESLWSVEFSPTDNDLLVLGDESGRITIIDVRTQSIIKEIRAHSQRVISTAFSPNGQVLASGSRDGTIALWDVTTWEPLWPLLEEHTGHITDLEFGNNDHLVSVGLDGQVLLWNLSGEPEVELSLTGHGGSVTEATFRETLDEMMLMTNGPEGSIILWDLKGDVSRGRWLPGHHDSVSSIDFSPDSSVLISGSADESIILWDLESGTAIGSPLLTHSDDVRDVAFQPQGDYIASADRDGNVILWELNGKQIEPRELEGHDAIVRSVNFSPDGSLLASSDDSGKIFLWDVEADRQIGEPLIGHNEAVFDVDFSPDGTLLATGSWDGKIQFWDLETLELSGESITTGMEQVWDIEFTPDGTILAAAGQGEKILLFDVADRTLDSQLATNQVNRISSIAFSPDGEMLASGSSDSTIEIWNIPDRRIVGLPLHTHSSGINSLKFSPDGHTLASADDYGKIIISIVDYENPKEKICDIVSRNLTTDEWAYYVGSGTAYEESCLDTS
jgi:WD40 repeat protein/energy-coupling factor transporter ATP-binding protein EcfA2